MTEGRNGHGWSGDRSGGWAEQVGGRYRMGWWPGDMPGAAALKRAAGVHGAITGSGRYHHTGHGQGHCGGYGA